MAQKYTLNNAVSTKGSVRLKLKRLEPAIDLEKIANLQLEGLGKTPLDIQNSKKLSLKKKSSELDNVELQFDGVGSAADGGSSSDSSPAPVLYAQSGLVATDATNATASNASSSSTVSSSLSEIPTAAWIGLGLLGVAGVAVAVSSSSQSSSSSTPTTAPTTSGTVADGYIRGAKIYIDVNGNGIADAGEFTGVSTGADGTFTLPSDSPKGTIIAVGGTNIDTGLTQTTPLKAPVGSTVINPLTTLVQVLIETKNLSAVEASSLVARNLGVTLPSGASLLSYDPIGAGDIIAQKAAVQLAIIFGIAESFNPEFDELIANSIANMVYENPGRIDLSSTSTIKTFLSEAGPSLEISSLYNKIVVGTKIISLANSISDISKDQLLLDVSKAGGTQGDSVEGLDTRIELNPNFNYADALLASNFANLAYDNQLATYANQFGKTGWSGISLNVTGIANAIDSIAGFGINDPVNWLSIASSSETYMQSFATAAKRIAADGTIQYVLSFEGSGSPLSQPEDWLVNAGEYGWSRYYESLMPIMTEVVRQVMVDKAAGKNVDLILTGHSLGGAAAGVAYADLLVDPTQNLWVEAGAPLAKGSRIYDQLALDAWSDNDIRSALIAATDVYTFGAPSFLIEPTKLDGLGFAAFAAKIAAGITVSGAIGAIGAIAGISDILTVDNDLLPNLETYSDHVFQFEHDNTTWYIPGDIVSQIGSNDAGTELDINLNNDIQWKYTGALLYLIPGGTHGMGNYEESVARLITDSTVLKEPNPLAETSPLLPYATSGVGTSANDHFLDKAGASGLAGNDLFVYETRGSYSAAGGNDDDTYVLANYGIELTLDASSFAGLDMLIFDLAGTLTKSAETIDGTGTLNDYVFTMTNGISNIAKATVLNWDSTHSLDRLVQINESLDVNWTQTYYDPATGIAYA